MTSNGAGEGPLLVAEQLAFDELSGDRSGVDRQRRARCAVLRAGESLGHQLLASAGFPEDQHGQIVAQHARDHAEHGLHRRASADQRQRIAHRASSTPSGEAALAPHGLAHRTRQLVDVEGLGEILEAPVSLADCGIERVLCRQDNDWHGRIAVVDHDERFNASPSGSITVGDQATDKPVTDKAVPVAILSQPGHAEAFGL
jgi:hypothetical protein